MTATTMRWLILPDIHDKLRRAHQIIEREPHDRLLLMGDFFDDFRTGVTDAADTADQVKEWLNDPNTTCLLGNHDMSYGWRRQNRQLVCPGYDGAKWSPSMPPSGTGIGRTSRYTPGWTMTRDHGW